MFFISFIFHWISPKTALVYNNFITLLIKRFPTSQLWHSLSSRVPLVFNGVRQNHHLPACNLRSVINEGKAPGGIPNSYCFSFLFLFKRNNWFWGFFCCCCCYYIAESSLGLLWSRSFRIMFFCLLRQYSTLFYLCALLWPRTPFCAVTHILFALTTEQRGDFVGPGQGFGPGLSVWVA